MKKITAVLGKSHNDLEHQLKDLLNEMCEVIENIALEQKEILLHQNKIAIKQYTEILQSSICESCNKKANIVTANITDGTYKSYCNKCLSKT